MSETAILDIVRKNFGDHLILGEEGGVIGDSSSDYLWCIDPLGMMFLQMCNSYIAWRMCIEFENVVLPFRIVKKCICVISEN